MLRSLTDELRIVLMPEQVGVVRLVLGRPQGEVKMAAVDGEGWEAVLQALAGIKHDGLWKGARCRVVLSDHFMRYQVLPWQDALASKEEWDAYARQALKTVFGSVAEGWRVNLSMHRFGTPLVAASIEDALLHGIEEMVKSMGLKLQALEPHFMVVFNRYRRHCRKADFWLLTHEAGGRLCLAKVNNGQWATLSSRQLSEDDAREPAVCVLREMAKHPDDAANKTLYIHASREIVPAFSQVLGAATQVIALAQGGFSGAGAEIRRMALC